ncbi:MAG TPA: ABC transporter substrate binding protein, partial [Hyphomicrobiaceae bacterium]|nr:ABC transporter substrate binding protein [Hyphomicrobiaceae bacterium]
MRFGRQWRHWLRRPFPGWRPALLLLAFGAILPATAQEPERRLLVLYPDSDIPAVANVSEGIRKKLASRSSLRVQTFREFLDLSRFPNPAHRQRVVRYLSEKYADTNLDAIVALGPDALRIAVENRAQLAPGVPIVFCCTSPTTLSAIERPLDVTGIVSEYNVARTVELARRLQPAARRLVVVAGAAPFDLRWVEVTRRQLASERDLEVHYLVGLSRQDLLSQVGRLSADTILVMLTVFRDGAGENFVPADIAEQVAMASTAPAYAPYARFVGKGFVGSYSDSFEEVGVQTGALILRIFDGEDPKTIAPQPSAGQTYWADARQLQRWGLPASRLPPDASLLFKEATLWENHRGTVLEAIATFVGLLAIVGVLLVQIYRRRKAETHLKQSEERLNFAAASAGLGLWHYDVGSNRLWCSEHCRSLFGFPAHGPLSADMLVARVHPDDRHVAVASMRAVTHGALASGVGEFRVARSGDELVWVQASGHRSLGDAGTPIRVSGIFRDITAYKQAQLEAKELSKRVLSIQDEERQRIARELHDSTAQHLAAMSLNLLALQGAKARKAAAIRSDLESLLQQAMKEVRSFSYLLYPQELANGDLIATLDRFIQGFRNRTGLDVTLRASNIGSELPE